VKSAKGAIGRALDQPDRAVRFYLFHGPDDAQSRAHGERLLKALGAARFIVGAGAIKSDPALLADEAGAMSLFGGPRAMWVEPAGDEIALGVEALLDAPAPESAVVAIAGALRKTSALLKLAEAHPNALAHASYAPEGKDAERMVVELGRTLGLRIAPDVAARIADAAANDQAIVAQELAKFALYLDATPEAPKELDHDSLDAVGAAMPEGDFRHLADHALAGDLAALADGLAALAAGGGEAIPVIRSLQRRLLMLAPIRARIDAGERPDAVLASLGKSLFWKDKALVSRLVAQWDSAGLAKVAERAGKLERGVILGVAPPGESLGEELVAIGRAARRR
jgi:DNA polymerase-3 subunit delta